MALKGPSRRGPGGAIKTWPWRGRQDAALEGPSRRAHSRCPRRAHPEGGRLVGAAHALWRGRRRPTCSENIPPTRRIAEGLRLRACVPGAAGGGRGRGRRKGPRARRGPGRGRPPARDRERGALRSGPPPFRVRDARAESARRDLPRPRSMGRSLTSMAEASASASSPARRQRSRTRADEHSPPLRERAQIFRRRDGC